LNTTHFAPIATALGTLATAFTAIVGVTKFSTAAKAEERLRRYAETKTLIELSQAFSDLMQRADGRSATIASEAAIEHLFATEAMKRRSADPQAMKDLLQTAGTIGIGTGEAAQSAAIASIAFFGCEYKHLNAPAQAGLAAVAKYCQDPPELAGLIARSREQLAAAERSAFTARR